MPTGYTSMIDDDPKLTTADWIMTGLARAFGVCVTLRDDSFNLTEKQIIKRLSADGKRDVNWHKRELAKAKKKAEILKNRTEEEWHKIWMENENRKKTDNEESIARKIVMKKRHTQVKEDLEHILENTMIDEVTRNIVKFGLEQLKLVERECEPWIEEPISFEDYRKNELSHNTRDIKYHTEEMAKAESRMKGRIESYQRLRKDVSMILVPEETKEKTS
jgi:hypothetical protein